MSSTAALVAHDDVVGIEQIRLPAWLVRSVQTRWPDQTWCELAAMALSLIVALDMTENGTPG